LAANSTVVQLSALVKSIGRASRDVTNAKPLYDARKMTDGDGHTERQARID